MPYGSFLDIQSHHGYNIFIDVIRDKACLPGSEPAVLMPHPVVMNNKYRASSALRLLITDSQHPMIIIGVFSPPAKSEPFIEFERHRPLRINLCFVPVYIIKHTYGE